MVFNSAKNKYDNDEDLENNSSSKKNTVKLNSNEDNISFNLNDSCDTAVSTAIISRDSNGSNNSNNSQNYFKLNSNGFLGSKNKPDIKKIYKIDGQDNLLTLQIKYALSKMKSQYSVNNSVFNKSTSSNFSCDYYFSNINDNNSNINIASNNEKQSNMNSSNRYNNYYNKFSIRPQNLNQKNYFFA